MVSRSTLILLLLTAVASVCGQNSRIDSLQQQLENTTSNEERARLLTNIGMQYYHRQVYFDSAFFYTQKAYDLSKQYELENMEANTLFNLGIIHNSINDYTSSIAYYEQSREIIERLNLVGPLGNVINNIGGCYFELKDYDTAIQYYQEALAMAQEQGDISSVGIDYMNIGEALYMKGDLEASKENLEKAIQALETIDFDPATVHLFYGRTLFAMNEVEKAKIEGEKALKIAEAKEHIGYIAESSELLSKVYGQLEEYSLAYANERKFRIYSDSLNTAKELNEIEKLKLNFELKENQEKLDHVLQKTKYQNIIYLLACVAVLMLVVLVFRQRKIVRMTKEIHDIQKRLVEQELNRREWKEKNPNTTAFEATLRGDEIPKN